MWDVTTCAWICVNLNDNRDIKMLVNTRSETIKGRTNLILNNTTSGVIPLFTLAEVGHLCLMKLSHCLH
jgi:hypothetical protein